VLNVAGYDNDTQDAQGVTTLQIQRAFQNYVSVYSAAKLVAQKSELNKVWTTGITPVALDLLSDYTPENLTFHHSTATVVGLTSEDVDRMLNLVNERNKFTCVKEKERAREAIQKCSNRLYFLSDTPIYHTRLVNEMMSMLDTVAGRKAFFVQLDTNDSDLASFYEIIPSVVFRLLELHPEFANLANQLVKGEEIVSILNRRLSLANICWADMTESDYLTLLVHLGIASVRYTGQNTVFKATSTYYRSKFLERLIQNSLGGLMRMKTAEDIYREGASAITVFLRSISESGMKGMILWARDTRRNTIMELQFQWFLLSAITASTLEAEDTQEDILGNGRTDVRIANTKFLLILELKQKKANAPPTPNELTKHHEQLSGYMRDAKASEHLYRLVVGFLVVVYDNGTKFYVEKTTNP
jgi:hypothetical protein